MAKSIKLTENNYIDSSGVVHKRTTLDKMFNGESSIGNIIVDDINSKNLFNYNNLVVQTKLSISIIDDELIVTRAIAGGGSYIYYNIFDLKIGQDYTIKSNSQIFIYKDRIYGEVYKSTNNASMGFSFKAEQSTYIIAIIIGSKDIPAVGDTLNCGKVQLELGSVATNYSNYIDFNALKGGGWNDIALINTYNYYDVTTYNKLQYKKVSNEVFIRGMLTNSVANPQGYYATCGTLPEECRPRKIAYLIADETGEVCDCVIQPNGEIRVYNKKANQWISLDSIRFFVD